MTERETLLQAMIEQALTVATVTPQANWFEAVCFAGGLRIARAGGTREEAIDHLRTGLWCEFNRAFDTLLTGGLDLVALVKGEHPHA